MRRFLLAGLVLRSQAAIGLQDEPTGWEQGHQGDECAAFLFGDAPFAPGPRSVTEPVKSPRIESGQPLAHGLLMAGELSRNGAGPQTLPTEGNHLRSTSPIGRGMTAASELAHLAFLSGMLRRASKQ